MPFILNAWYVVAWPLGLPAETLLARTVCNNAMVLWRDTSGEIHAAKRVYDRHPGRQFYSVPTDKAGLAARRLVAEMIDAEQLAVAGGGR